MTENEPGLLPHMALTGVYCGRGSGSVSRPTSGGDGRIALKENGQMGIDCSVVPKIREVDAKSIINRSKLADYAVNPYTGCSHACAYCYASYMNHYSGHEEPWGSYVDVKNWPEIRRPEKYADKSIFVGSVTDPYQPAEASYCRTRRFLEQMQSSGARIGITTKSDLILRDLDLLRSMPGAHVTFSINTLDEELRQQMDCASPVKDRLAAIRALHEAGIPTTCFIAPVMPGLTGVPSIILAARDICDTVYVDALNLRGSNRGTVFRLIAERHPDLLDLYKGIYERQDRRYWDALHRQLTKLAEQEGFSYSRRGCGQIVRDGKPHIIYFTR